MKTELFNEKDMIEVQKLLRANNKSITTAESCTGGLVAHCITKISGSSDIFNGSIVSYSNEIKNKELNVKLSTLENHGAVSIEVVEEMLKGSIKKFNADFAIAISGIAGPNGGTKSKPVGTVVIGISDSKAHKIVDIHHFNGTREEVQEEAVKMALKKVFKFLRKSLDK